MFYSKKYISIVEILSKDARESSNSVHIALTFDDNYVLLAGVTIFSLINHNPNICFNFRLYVDKITENNLTKIK